MDAINKPICYFLIGPPGSGKSTWVRDLPNKFVVISTDTYIEKVALQSGKTYGDVFKDNIKDATKEMEMALQKATVLGKSIIWDQTNMSVKSRAGKLITLKKYDVIAVAFEIPPDELARRLKKRKAETGKDIPPHIVASMVASYQPPTMDEGFFSIVKVTK